jgi:hypothetical protein
MQRQHTATVRTRTQDRRPWLITACTVALLAAAAAGLWRVAGQHEGATTTPADQAAAVSAPASAARNVYTTRSPADTPLTVYVVSSEHDAMRLTDALRAGDTILAQFGRQPFAAQVVVAGTPEEADFIARANAEADAIRASMGLPPMLVIDLRSQ